MCNTKAEVNGRIIFIITNTEGERDQIYRLVSFKFFPTKIHPTFVQDPPYSQLEARKTSKSKCKQESNYRVTEIRQPMKIQSICMYFA